MYKSDIRQHFVECKRASAHTIVEESAMVALGMHRRLESEYRKPPMHPGVAESSDYPRDVEIGLDGAIVIYRYSRVYREYAHIDTRYNGGSDVRERTRRSDYYCEMSTCRRKFPFHVNRR